MTDRFVCVAGIVTLAGVAVSIGSIVVLHLLPTGLSPLRDAVSHYGITRYRWGYRIGALSLGVAGAAEALALAHVMPDRPLVAALLMLFAVVRWVIGWFPMDVPDHPVTWTGGAHVVLAIIAFAGISVAAVRFHGDLRRTDLWPEAVAVSRMLTWFLCLAGLAMVPTRMAPSLRGFFGAAERVFYVGMYGWVIFVGMLLIRRCTIDV
jgi:hypothetical protein